MEWLRGLLIAPLQRLYFLGPGYLFWEGRAYADICAQMTSIPAAHWAHAMPECMDLIDRKFMAFLVPIEVCVLLFVMFGALCTCWWRWCIVRPFERVAVEWLRTTKSTM